jgi:O-Antigen ligase/PDZ domain
LSNPKNHSKQAVALLAQRVAVVGFILYAAFAPHSIAAAEISLAIVGGSWLVRALATGTTGFRRTKLDLPICIFLFWTIAAAVFSEEPRISIAKLQSVCVVFLFYLTQAIVRRRTAIVLVSIMILSGVTGSLFSIYDLLRGRGVVVESISSASPFREVNVQPGDTIWRVGRTRVYSKDDIDRLIATSEPGKRLTVSLITNGEHDERPGFLVTPALKSVFSPSAITGSERSHRFRASGWTRHYETFAEILQMLTQLALGLAFANFQNHGANRRFKLATAGTIVMAVGIGLTAMRTALVALAIGAAVVTMRAARGRARVLVAAAIGLVLGFGAVVVWKTRATNALLLDDPSSALRVEVARVGLARIPIHPVLGHGMDAVKRHWNEWGFPGNTHIHLHSTPLQIAFDRGLPALLFWLWIVWVCWQMTQRAERLTRDSGDSNVHGVLLGAVGALAGFFASSLVNYNFGDGEVALVFWWLMGIVVVLSPETARENLN